MKEKNVINLIGLSPLYQYMYMYHLCSWNNLEKEINY